MSARPGDHDPTLSLVRRETVPWKLAVGVVELLLSAALLAVALLVSLSGAVPMGLCAGVFGLGFAAMGAMLLLRPFRFVCARCGAPWGRLRTRYAPGHRGALERGLAAGGEALVEAAGGPAPDVTDRVAVALVIDHCARCGDTGAVRIARQDAAMIAVAGGGVSAWSDDTPTAPVELDGPPLHALIQLVETRGAEVEPVAPWWTHLLPW